MITVTNLSKSYGKKEVLKDVSFILEPSKVYGIVGSNGAGKTTLFRCIAGLESYNGHIHADRTPLKNYLGLLPADPYFPSKLTGEEYIYLLADARGIQVTDLEERNIFQLPLREYASEYSTGMKKKLALTAILLQRNRYFILDEPYNGIDFESALILTSIISKLRSLGKTVLISSHIFSTLKECCDQILVLENGQTGKMIAQDAFDELEDKMKKSAIGKDIDKLIEG
ncbi:ABC-2 type transport system ATP-binding protein [Sphingobacterium allocomposti]|uniref:ABC-2 type transport system ATP-binding protein n=1 Tax=Sphingobacterium allocomposti TaxID=415956 RepID=A0A5S5DPD5_9SPHI|nr:ATP-binding cassette domain-containing protein [Sphingobacterium composti Yoo et al. 2007 non Ten et al. 2007]TYP97803.1 ABC-2 type transport system ATP-binding protein [Sphingobacterium composti Yoo et al. 2007 non Ten et al. 2007]